MASRSTRTIPISFDAKKFGHSIASDVRRPLYWDLFGGACGHTYGNHAVWQMWTPAREAHQQSTHAVDRGDRTAWRRCRCSTRAP